MTTKRTMTFMTMTAKDDAKHIENANIQLLCNIFQTTKQRKNHFWQREESKKANYQVEVKNPVFISKCQKSDETFLNPSLNERGKFWLKPIKNPKGCSSSYNCRFSKGFFDDDLTKITPSAGGQVCLLILTTCKKSLLICGGVEETVEKNKRSCPLILSLSSKS